jgi:hypothetical protein
MNRAGNIALILALRDLSIKLGGVFVDPTMYAQWQDVFLAVFA